MENILLEYGMNRLSQMGYDRTDVHWEAKKVEVNKTALSFNAQNELWILFDVTNVEDNFIITSDTTKPINRDIFVSDAVPFLFDEFTGNISINATGANNAHTFAFIRFVPGKRKSKNSHRRHIRVTQYQEFE